MKTLMCIYATFLMTLSGCVTTSRKAVKVEEKVSHKLSQGVYATNDSMTVGRFDLAKKYSDQTIRLIAPPKERVKILPFYAK